MTHTKPSQAELCGELLTNEQQYHKEVHASEPELTREQEQAYLSLAKAGDKEAREKLIVSCLPYIMHLAGKYSYMAHCMNPNSRIEYLDLVEIGNMIVVERFERALTKPNPMGYLRTAVSGLLIAYLKEQADGIKVTRTKKDEHRASFRVVSLDAPLVSKKGISTRPVSYADILAAPAPVEPPEQDYRPVYQALETLSEQQRELVTCLYGLGCAPEALTEIMNRQRLSQGKEPTSGNAVSTTPKRNALNKLKKVLEPLYASA